MATMVVGLTTFSATVNSEPIGVRLNTISTTSKYLSDDGNRSINSEIIKDILQSGTPEDEARLKNDFGIEASWIEYGT